MNKDQKILQNPAPTPNSYQPGRQHGHPYPCSFPFPWAPLNFTQTVSALVSWHGQVLTWVSHRHDKASRGTVRHSEHKSFEGNRQRPRGERKRVEDHPWKESDSWSHPELSDFKHLHERLFYGKITQCRSEERRWCPQSVLTESKRFSWWMCTLRVMV